uniref:Uncharacterized protein n=1 Tax=Rhizophora mucronata TaxID=61149 RepID=A0A2P2NLP3_RHIMU
MTKHHSTKAPQISFCHSQNVIFTFIFNH